LHRDFQSRNILVDRDKYYIIDFQAARLGPLQYDLASLLIDPYVRLASSTQEKLLMYYVERLSDSVPVNEAEFIYSYKYCAISRNLQILGAFGFLSKVKGKKDFEAYIPAAINSLKRNLDMIEPQVCPQLRSIVKEL
jgi:aminoglycoside/choline kinase family phosphotransferase